MTKQDFNVLKKYDKQIIDVFVYLNENEVQFIFCVLHELLKVYANFSANIIQFGPVNLLFERILKVVDCDDNIEIYLK